MPPEQWGLRASATPAIVTASTTTPEALIAMRPIFNGSSRVAPSPGAPAAR